jgi:acyl-CoA reductase-like NAD-dependent aldehyde dehydrogenase
MAATAISVDTLPSINPATGEALGYFERTPTSALPQIFSRARTAQAIWARVLMRQRCAHLRDLRDCILSSRNALADAVVAESGKPRVEALFADIFVAVDTAAYFAKSAGRLLEPERVPHHSLAAKAKSGKVTYEPLGVIGIISSWNYPLAIPLSQIIPATAVRSSKNSLPMLAFRKI